MLSHRFGICILGCVVTTLWLLPSRAPAYVEAPMSLGAVIAQSTHIMVLRVEKVDKERNLILFRKVKDLKGQHPADVIKHNIGRGGFHPREWQITMDWAAPGKTAVFFHNGGASETCIDNYWYQAYAGGEWWNMSHAEPYLLRSFAGKPDKLAAAVTAIVAGQEVVVPCMLDGDKNAIQLRTGKLQRMRAGLKLQDYNPKRDFVSWGGGEDVRPLAGMPAFAQIASLGRTDPGAVGVAPADFDGDGKTDLCLFGAGKVVLLQNAGNAFNEVGLPYAGGAHDAHWADYNGDGKPDLLLATPTGPRLLTNLGDAFRDDSNSLPNQAYYPAAAAAWLDFDGDKKPDILLANGLLGPRLYRNAGTPAVGPAGPLAAGNWHYAGPFDNAGNRGFDAVYPPEKEIDLKKEYAGKNGEKVIWREGKLADGQINSLALFQNNNEAVVYLYREFDSPTAMNLPVSLGSDDTLTVWLNGEKLLAENVYRPAAPDQNQLTLKLKPGKNRLLLKVCQGGGEWAFYFAPKAVLPAAPTWAFEDMTARLLKEEGQRMKDEPGGGGSCLAVGDVNGDGRPDFLLGRHLYLNTPPAFVPVKESGLQLPEGRCQAVFADFNGDKHPDLLVAHSAGCKLFRNDGKGKFADVTGSAGELSAPIPHATALFPIDFDRDGKLDLFVACLKGPNRFFRNLGEGKFADAGETLGLYQRTFNTRGLCVLDLNKDGAFDLVLNNEGQESVVLLGNAARVALQGGKP